jgi:hypothetical protein
LERLAEFAERVHALLDGFLAEQFLAELEAFFGEVFGVHALLAPSPKSVMAGLIPAIHDFLRANQDVDTRHKAGHDVERLARVRTGQCPAAAIRASRAAT